MSRFLAFVALLLMVEWIPHRCESFEFQILNFQRNARGRWSARSTRIEAHSQPEQEQQQAADHGSTSSPLSSHTDNKAMAFLKKIGKVGGAANKDYRFAMGVDEGPVGKATSGSASASGTLRKVKQAYRSCDLSGVVDDLTEAFPLTSSGTKWSSVTDRVMGGRSSGKVMREESFHGRPANVLRGSVALLNSNDGSAAGFVQMATNLAIVDADGVQTVDASKYDGVELQVSCETTNDQSLERFNIHLKTTACAMPFSSYRASFMVPKNDWATVRIPWSEFKGHGPGARDAPFDSSHLVRAGIVAIGREMDVTLGVSSFRFYKKETLRP